MECAQACAKAGSPLVILADNGSIYWPTTDAMPATSQNDKLLPFAGKRVVASGKEYERGGSKAQLIEKIEAEKQGLATAHELHDLDTRAIWQRGRGPRGALHDVAVKLNGEPRGIQLQRAHQTGDGLARAHFAIFAIHHDSKRALNCILHDQARLTPCFLNHYIQS